MRSITSFPIHLQFFDTSDPLQQSQIALLPLAVQTSKHKKAKMRLPGTFNFAGNGLPTANFLNQYQALKDKQRAQQGADDSKTDKPTAQTSEKKDADKAKAAAATGAKPEDGGEFTKAQDEALIELKIKETSWKAIATELGKEVNQVKERFKAIKPDDFDKKLMEAKNAKKSGGGGNKDNKTEEPKQGTAGGNDGGGNNGGGKQDKKAKWEAEKEAKAKAKAQEQKGGEGGEGGNWWEQPDEHWSKDNVSILFVLCLPANFVSIS